MNKSFHYTHTQESIEEREEKTKPIGTNEHKKKVFKDKYVDSWLAKEWTNWNKKLNLGWTCRIVCNGNFVVVWEPLNEKCDCPDYIVQVFVRNISQVQDHTSIYLYTLEGRFGTHRCLEYKN